MGIKPTEFWGLTPWETFAYIEAQNKAIKAEREHATWCMWHGAVLARMQTIPPLERFLPELKQAAGNSFEEMRLKVRAYNAMRKANGAA